ncbi:HUS1 [Sanghuangporus vaninii]
MRFRANIEHVQTFQRIIQAIEKLQKRCIVRFTETEMHIICNAETEDGVQVWSRIKVVRLLRLLDIFETRNDQDLVQDSLFSDYRIASNANNEINLSLSPEALSQALRSAASSSDIVMKLLKKDGHAVLTFEIVLALGSGGLGGFGSTGGGGGGSRKASIAHDVLIDLLKPTDVRRLKEPLCPEPDIHFLLPPLQKLRTIVERMRSMADVLCVQANHRGGLRLSVESDQVRVQTQWSKCIIPNLASDPTGSQQQQQRSQSLTQSQTINAQDSDLSRTDDPDPDTDPEPEKDANQWYSVHLSIRAFLKFLSSHVVSTTTIACICEDHCMILYVYIGEVQDAGGVLTFWIPARLSGADY